MKEKKDENVHAGHRERLRERLRREGLSAFAEHEVLELLLTYAIPQRDVNPLAHALIRRFGGLNHVLQADESELLRVPGVGPRAASLLSLLPQLMRYMQLSALGDRLMIANFEQARAYCVPLFAGAREECVYMVCLGQSGRVLHLALLHTGTLDEVMLYPRKIVEMALRHNAHSVLLAHNHPGGTAHPSRLDVITTRRIALALSSIGVQLLDHLVLAGDDAFSIVRSGLFSGLSAELDAPEALQEQAARMMQGCAREDGRTPETEPGAREKGE